MEHDTPALALTRAAISGEPIEVFFDAFAAFVRSSFDGARLCVAIADLETGRLVCAYGPDVELSNADQEPRLARALRERRPIAEADAAFYPLTVGSKTVGVAAIYQPTPRAASEPEAQLIGAYLGYLALRIEREALLQRISDLESLAAFDALTGILNRRSFDERLVLEWNRAMRAGESVAIIMLDIDFFKAFNDRYGHVAGDFCLRTVARALHEGIGRAGDMVARYGGEEFAAILPGTELPGAIEVAEKMRAAVGALSIPHDASSLGRVSISMGVATMQATPEYTPAAALEKADRALYDAKLRGRNRVVAEDYASDAPAAEPRREQVGNLPTPPTSFFGRMAELINIRRLFAETRLVTLTGVEGIGKTRLAIAHGSSVASQFENGVWFVDLAAATSEDELLQALARSLDLRGSLTGSFAEAILARLQSANALIVFDNCEHLLGPLAHLASRILSEAPLVAVLVTSREHLNIAGERILPVPSLGVDEAIELFGDRAAAVGTPPFRDASRRAAAAVCERLGRIPLTLELAAAGLRGMSLDDLSLRLDERLAALPREETLAALIDWSYASLREQERTVLNRIAVFPASFSAEAACAVCASLPRDVTSVTLNRLYDKRLIEALPDCDPPRFRLLMPIRAFAKGRLLARTPHAVSAPHAVFFLNFAQKMDEARATMDPQLWRAAMRPERENFVQALRWALELEQDPALGGKLAAALSTLWAESAEQFAGLGWLESALDPNHDVDDATRAALQQGRSRVLLNLGRHHDAESSAHSALELFTALGDTYGAAGARAFIGDVRTELGDASGALEWLSTAREEFLAGGHERELAGVLIALGSASLGQGNCEAAHEFQSQALELAQRLGDDLLVAVAHGNLGETMYCLGDFQQALHFTERAVEALPKIDAKGYLARYLSNLAMVKVELGVPEQAAAPLRDALVHFATQPESLALVNCLDLIAGLGSDDAAGAARLYGYADALCARMSAKFGAKRLARREGDKIKLRRSIGDRIWSEATSRGAALTKKQALELATRRLKP